MMKLSPCSKNDWISRARPETVSLWIILLIPFFINGLFVFRYSVNIPYYDDYDVILNFMNTFVQTETPMEKASLLFLQHNEHRIVFDRIITICYYYLFGEVDFKSLIVFGNLGWALTVSMLMVCLKKNLNSLYYLIPIPYFLLSFSHWENMFFAMAAIQNYWFIFFTIAFLISLSKDKVILSCVFFLMALFTSGGGVVLYPLGNLFLILRKKWKFFLFFFTVSTCCIIFYFHGYYKPPYHPGILEVALNPFRAMTYFLIFLGNVVPLQTKYSALPIGFLLCSLAAYLVLKRHDHLFWKLIICFVIMIASLTTITRSGFGVEQAAASRYSLFPLLVLISIYVLAISSKMPRMTSIFRSVLFGVVVGAVLFWGTSFFFIERNHYFLSMKNQRVASIAEFNDGNKNDLLYPNKDQAAQILLLAEQRRIYDYRSHIAIKSNQM